jgi:hypothetical protein
LIHPHGFSTITLGMQNNFFALPDVRSIVLLSRVVMLGYEYAISVHREGPFVIVPRVLHKH